MKNIAFDEEDIIVILLLLGFDRVEKTFLNIIKEELTNKTFSIDDNKIKFYLREEEKISETIKPYIYSNEWFYSLKKGLNLSYNINTEHSPVTIRRLFDYRKNKYLYTIIQNMDLKEITKKKCNELSKHFELNDEVWLYMFSNVEREHLYEITIQSCLGTSKDKKNEGKQI